MSDGKNTAFSRTKDLLGEEAFDKLTRAFVIILGLGGVGSHTAVSLVRSGVENLRIIDTDPVTLSSLNRHAVAVLDDVGENKTEIVKRRLQAINPEAKIDAVKAFFNQDTAATLLAGEPSLVIDAIDSLNPKVNLLVYCKEHGLDVVSSMGASAHTDPTAIAIDDIFKTSICPLAKAVRVRLRRRGVLEGFAVVYSTERPAKALLPDEEDEINWRGRRRNRLSSFSPIPGIFGYALASLAIEKIGGIRLVNKSELSL